MTPFITGIYKFLSSVDHSFRGNSPSLVFGYSNPNLDKKELSLLYINIYLRAVFVNTPYREEIITCKFKTCNIFYVCGAEVMCREYLKYLVRCDTKKNKTKKYVTSTLTEKMN